MSVNIDKSSLPLTFSLRRVRGARVGIDSEHRHQAGLSFKGIAPSCSEPYKDMRSSGKSIIYLSQSEIVGAKPINQFGGVLSKDPFSYHRQRLGTSD